MKCDAVERRKESEDKNKSIIEIKIKFTLGSEIGSSSTKSSSVNFRES